MCTPVRIDPNEHCSDYYKVKQLLEEIWDCGRQAACNCNKESTVMGTLKELIEIYDVRIKEVREQEHSCKDCR